MGFIRNKNKGNAPFPPIPFPPLKTKTNKNYIRYNISFFLNSRTTKYTLLSFLPLSFFYQVLIMINCLVQTSLQCVLSSRCSFDTFRIFIFITNYADPTSCACFRSRRRQGCNRGLCVFFNCRISHGTTRTD
jgi:hypothetical protein